jgi:hypothetical protein
VKLHAWSTKWLVNFNPQKTETMTVSRKLNKPHQPNLIMNNTIISTVTEHKHLGLQLSDDGNWNKHIDMITKKAFSRVNILRKFKFILDWKTLETIYITFIRPLCLFQLPSSESCSPRCLCSVTVLMIVLFIIRLG